MVFLMVTLNSCWDSKPKKFADCSSQRPIDIRSRQILLFKVVLARVELYGGWWVHLSTNCRNIEKEIISKQPKTNTGNESLCTDEDFEGIAVALAAVAVLLDLWEFQVKINKIFI
ncbi:serine/threonine protein kinase [Striga asiatica]|uniref:Serine/threonine protein kinase n=1 Tax=Striga asiatica TaxID=4170 RepID=A0A5A7PME9_STRAF|nr:serine/threonine protein kinase [Striga asiatica]